MYHHKKLLIYQLVKNMLSKAFLEKKVIFFSNLKGKKANNYMVRAWIHKNNNFTLKVSNKINTKQDGKA